MNLPFHPRDRVGIFCTVVIWPPRATGCQPESRLGTAHFCLVLICAFLSTCIFHFSEYYCQSTKLPRRCTFLSTCILCLLMQTHSSCLESLFTLSLYDEPSAAVEGGGGAQINDSREPQFLPAAQGSQPKQGSSHTQQG